AVNTFTAQDNILWVRGRHSVTFGFQFQALQDNYNNPLTGTLAGFTFSNNETAGYSATGTVMANTGNAYAGYLLGATAAGSVTQNAVRRRAAGTRPTPRMFRMTSRSAHG